MPDYGHELEFGYSLVPDTSNPKGVLQTARYLDELGYDVIGVQDHPYFESRLEAYSVIAMILAQTERVRVYPNVTNIQMRHAAIIAKAAASLDQLSDGRFEMGLGAGAPHFADQAIAMGAMPLSVGDRVDALEETIAVCRAYWSGKPDARVTGVFHQLAGIQGGPVPAHDIEIWIGAARRRMLRLVGRTADAWVIPLMRYVVPGKAASRNATIDEAARDIGRDPADIRRMYGVLGRFADEAISGMGDEDSEIVGPVDHWVDVLTHHAVDFGFSTFSLSGTPSPEETRLFINEVAPRVRERVAEIRQG
jgi:alkanesulfonate monooxygenase SsuD/methylene tetrahydromethanopterin reductase-like flavin-dependent oxidoreductase (luciferase family)